jgi:hypothetical protein
MWTAAAEVLARSPLGKLDRRALLLCAVVVIAEAGYVFIGSTGYWTRWPLMELRIDQLAESFRAGHLHLLIEPSPALLAAANPGDPVNGNLWYWDASLYHGHYYFYWGPVPALLLAAVKIAFRISRPLGDYYPFMGLVTLHLLAGTLLIERIARRLFPEASPLRVAGAALVFAFANPIPFMLSRPAIYEAAVVGAEAFTLLGLLAALEAVNAAHDRWKANWCAFAAGTALALAVGCRISFGAAVVALGVATAAFAARRGRATGGSRFIEVLAAIGLPIALGVAGLLAYNRLRFDHWLEFGQRYQLTWVPWSWSPGFIRANLYSYALREAHLTCHFPFVSAVTDMGAAAFPAGFHLAPNYFTYEPVIGLLSAVPLAWLAPAALIPPRRLPEPIAIGLRSLVVNLAVAAALPLAVILCAPSATMRYDGDFAAPIVVLGIVGAWNLRRVTAPRSLARRIVAAVALSLGALTIAIGVALGFTGYYQSFVANNPAMMAKLDSALSICGKQR